MLATRVIEETTEHSVTWQPIFGTASRIHRGILLTADRAVGDPSEKRLLWNRHQACAVDMESAAAAEWCAERGIPFGSLRAITDDAQTAISPAVASLIGENSATIRQSLRALAMRPFCSARELWQLSRNASIASRRLAEALTEAFAPSAVTMGTLRGRD
jgi:nucleoside phosphorylase